MPKLSEEQIEKADAEYRALVAGGENVAVQLLSTCTTLSDALVVLRADENVVPSGIRTEHQHLRASLEQRYSRDCGWTKTETHPERP